MQPGLSGTKSDWQQKASIKLAGVHTEEVYLVFGVGVCEVSVCAVAVPTCVHDQHALVLAQPPPLALDAPEPPPDIEREIATGMFPGPVDRRTQFHRRKLDLQLGDQAFVVRCQHRTYVRMSTGQNRAAASHRTRK